MGVCVYQVGAGLKKFVVKTRDDRNSVSNHGVLGPIVYVFSMATGIAGLNALVPDQHAWRAVVSVTMSFTALVTVLFVFYGPAEIRDRARRAAGDLDINSSLLPTSSARTEVKK